jgi:hypothetical protein
MTPVNRPEHANVQRRKVKSAVSLGRVRYFDRWLSRHPTTLIFLCADVNPLACDGLVGYEGHILYLGSSLMDGNLSASLHD